MKYFAECRKIVLQEDLDMENKIEEIIKRLMESNEENFEYIENGYERGYAEGVHDGLLDVLNALRIKTDEKYYN